MSEMDALDPEDAGGLVFHEQLVEPIQLTLFTPPPQPGLCASASLAAAPGSRDRYPRPPPSMIISPAHRRSLSADRQSHAGGGGGALQQQRLLVKRLGDVIDDVDDRDDVIGSGGVTSERDDDDRQAAARDAAEASGGGKTDVASLAAVTSSPASSVTSAASSGGGGSRLSRWTLATLALWRGKKSRLLPPRTDNKQAVSLAPADSVPSSVPGSGEVAVVDTRPLQRASLSSGAHVICMYIHIVSYHII